VISNMRTAARYSGYRPEDRLVGFLPLFHVFGQNHIMNACLEAGATLLLFRRFSPDTLLPALRRARATLFFGVPTVYIALLNADTRPAELGPIRYFFSAAATLPEDVSRRWTERFGLPIHEGYGLTECSPFAAYNHVNRHKPGSVGTAVEGFDIRILDDEGREVPRGTLGEICIRGPGVMLGYWRKPQDTEQALRGGWLHSGDIGTMDDDGYVSIVDRVKDMINVAGFKVWPAEVEHVLYRHPAVRELAVYGEPHPQKGESVRAAVVLRTGATVHPADLISFCRERLALYKAPERIDFFSDLPKSATGKILKRLLRARA
jgi:long-chain acyl-CoA synthetase